MPELTADVFLSLDGFATGSGRGQGFTAGYDGPEFTRLVQQVLDEPQVIVMGRVTYQDMSRYWPSATGPVAAAMNTHPKLRDQGATAFVPALRGWRPGTSSARRAAGRRTEATRCNLLTAW